MGTLIGIVLFVVYAGGIYKFWNGFNRTNFSSGRIPLALFWPVLFIANKSYRQNFTKALKG